MTSGNRLGIIDMGSTAIRFLVAEVGVLLLIAYWPDLTLFMPRLLGLASP